MCILCSVKKRTEWFTMSFGHLAKSQRVLAFCVQVWVVGIWPNLFFSPPHTTLSCSCEFFMNSPSGLAFGHNHFLLNPVSGTLSTDIELFAIYAVWLTLQCSMGELCNYVDSYLKRSKFCVRNFVQDKFEPKMSQSNLNSVKCPP